MTFTIEQIYAFTIGLMAFIISVGGVASVVAKAVAKAKQPNKEQDEKIDKLTTRVDALEKNISTHSSFFTADKARIKSLEDSNIIIMESILALLAHGIDGNNVNEMKTASKHIQDYLLRGNVE